MPPAPPWQAVPTTCGGEGTAGGAAPIACAAAPSHDLALAACIVAVAVLGLAYVRANERRRAAAGHARAPRGDATPYLAGAALGLVFAVSLLALHRPVGVSGGVQHVVGLFGRHLFPDYFGAVVPAGVTPAVATLVGLVFGAYLSAAFGGTFRARTLPESGWVERFGSSRPRRWLVAFAGAAVVELAGAIAGGCTSGLALSGGIALAPGAFVFMAAMFATGIPAALLVGRRR